MCGGGEGETDTEREREREIKRLNIPLVPWPAPKIRFYLCNWGFHLRRDFVMKTWSHALWIGDIQVY